MMRCLHISLKAFEPSFLRKVSDSMYNVCTQLQSQKKTTFFFTLVGLPSLRKYFTVLRSPHVHKKSREQFIMQQHKAVLRMNVSLNPFFQSRVLFASKHMIWSGVQVKHVTQYSSTLWASDV